MYRQLLRRRNEIPCGIAARKAYRSVGSGIRFVSMGNIRCKCHRMPAHRIVHRYSCIRSFACTMETRAHHGILRRVHHLLHIHQRELPAWQGPFAYARHIHPDKPCIGNGCTCCGIQDCVIHIKKKLQNICHCHPYFQKPVYQCITFPWR